MPGFASIAIVRMRREPARVPRGVANALRVLTCQEEKSLRHSVAGFVLRTYTAPVADAALPTTVVLHPSTTTATAAATSTPIVRFIGKVVWFQFFAGVQNRRDATEWLLGHSHT